jgi:3,4-dihydroxy-2-butanone 4-phosphate synthase
MSVTRACLAGAHRGGVRVPLYSLGPKTAFSVSVNHRKTKKPILFENRLFFKLIALMPSYHPI